MAAKTKKHMKRKTQRIRCRVEAWLYANRDDELLMLDEIDLLKKQRKWRPTLVNALKLFLDLRDGKIDLLQALFPGVVARIQQDYAALIQSPVNSEFARILENQTRILERMTPIAPAPLPMASAMPPLSSLTGNIFVDAAPADPTEARKNFTSGMGDLFADDDDDF